jgi:hypothetical protein
VWFSRLGKSQCRTSLSSLEFLDRTERKLVDYGLSRLAWCVVEKMMGKALRIS